MTRSHTLPVLALAAALVAALCATAFAAPSTSRTLTYQFSDCTGPAGTPIAFDAVKQPGGAAALHMTDGGNFVAKSAVDAATGEVLFSTPGFEKNNRSTVTCTVVIPGNDRPQLVTGLITPAG